MTSAMRFLMGFWAFAAVMSAADYCSLVVEVGTPNGKKPTASVTVVEPGGRKVDRFSEGQDVSFCDLGLRPVTVKVGDDGTCNQVVVKEVPLFWAKAYHLKVVYDPKPCLKDLPHLQRFCTYLFRISDINGAWIPGASVHVMPGDLTLKSDSSGRVSVDPRIGSLSLTISAAGYTSQSFNGTCTAQKATEPQEEFIRLARQ